MRSHVIQLFSTLHRTLKLSFRMCVCVCFWFLLSCCGGSDSLARAWRKGLG